MVLQFRFIIEQGMMYYLTKMKLSQAAYVENVNVASDHQCVAHSLHSRRVNQMCFENVEHQLTKLIYYYESSTIKINKYILIIRGSK